MLTAPVKTVALKSSEIEQMFVTEETIALPSITLEHMIADNEFWLRTNLSIKDLQISNKEIISQRGCCHCSLCVPLLSKTLLHIEIQVTAENSQVKKGGCFTFVQGSRILFEHKVQMDASSSRPRISPRLIEQAKRQELEHPEGKRKRHYEVQLHIITALYNNLRWSMDGQLKIYCKCPAA
ncbi:hypothetical protein MKW98_020167 [Papaver atlanticum]|uniref:Uncharacterized protein n=1 Tax=Papaver atlanticum TaxID=357466 RepID=A0AAD4S9H3_9MAGN|nr:hypothetical protein MKW98_020167 [Papaver atlanticum]